MKILAIDPGETTGVVLMDTDNLGSLQGATVHLWDRIDLIIQEMVPDVLVFEAWRLYPHMAKIMIGNEFLPVQVIGVLRYLAEKHHIPVVLQTAAQAKGIKPSEIPQSISGPHLRDAWCHAEYYRRFHKEG